VPDVLQVDPDLVGPAGQKPAAQERAAASITVGLASR
jgi:hypothetical protein